MVLLDEQETRATQTSQEAQDEKKEVAANIERVTLLLDRLVKQFEKITMESITDNMQKGLDAETPELWDSLDTVKTEWMEIRQDLRYRRHWILNSLTMDHVDVIMRPIDMLGKRWSLIIPTEKRGVVKATLTMNPHMPFFPPKITFADGFEHPNVLDGTWRLLAQNSWSPIMALAEKFLLLLQADLNNPTVAPDGKCPNPDALRLYDQSELIFS